MRPEFEKRSAVIELKPDMCSLTLSSLNFINSASINSPDIIQKLAIKMDEYGVKPELECFDLGMINYGKYLIEKGIIKGPFYWNLLFGNIAGMQANLNQISTAVNEIPDNHFIAFGGLGSYQSKITNIAISSGYGVRIGLEDNIWFNKAKNQQPKNVEFVKRVHQIMEINENELFTSKELGSYGFYNTKRD